MFIYYFDNRLFRLIDYGIGLVKVRGRGEREGGGGDGGEERRGGERREGLLSVGFNNKLVYIFVYYMNIRRVYIQIGLLRHKVLPTCYLINLFLPPV